MACGFGARILFLGLVIEADPLLIMLSPPRLASTVDTQLARRGDSGKSSMRYLLIVRPRNAFLEIFGTAWWTGEEMLGGKVWCGETFVG